MLVPAIKTVTYSTNDHLLRLSPVCVYFLRLWCAIRLAEQTPKWLENNNNGTSVDSNGVSSTNEILKKKKWERKGQIDSFNVIHHRNMLLGYSMSRVIGTGSHLYARFTCFFLVFFVPRESSRAEVHLDNIILLVTFVSTSVSMVKKNEKKKRAKKKHWSRKIPLPCADIGFFSLVHPRVFRVRFSSFQFNSITWTLCCSMLLCICMPQRPDARYTHSNQRHR